ncbi:uncharacterized protein net isoform X2 [Prorops nasuta]|uniref:uncharacterized protein net isoform X2 n=1 Tax=Prorops nasuta TaxID=863751 RepID=UPI0034CF13F5
MSRHVVETSSELSDFIKGGVMAGSEKDTGFCSGADEDDMSGLHSPSASEDSVEVQVSPISLRNKRKLAEPRKIKEPSTAPLKKRRFNRIDESVVADEESRPAAGSPSPFRPWSASSSGKSNEIKVPCSSSSSSSSSLSSSSSSTSSKATVNCLRLSAEQQEERRREDEEIKRRHEARIQEEVLARLKSRADSPIIEKRGTVAVAVPSVPISVPVPTSLVGTTGLPNSKDSLSSHPRLQEEPLALVLRGEVPRVPSHPAVSGSYDRNQSYPMDHAVANHYRQNQQQSGSQSGSQSSHSRHQQQSGQQQQRNYKNMTRERRIEANARERTRVHTISAAFDTLRRAIPAYSHNQKLSKLSVLRIACSYIMTLGKIVNTPEGESANGASLGACVDLVSRTIQTEGKLRKRKDD